MPIADLAMLAAAFLTVALPSGADVVRREVASPAEARLLLRSGREIPCSVTAWSGEFLEISSGGSVATHRWEDLKPASVLQLLRALVSEKDAAMAADAAAIVLAQPDAEAQGRAVVEWARRLGATKEQVAAARVEAEALRHARLERDAKAEDARLRAEHPEAGRFPSTAWSPLPPEDFDAASAEALEAARATLARAGGSATLFETASIALLAEGADDVFRADAAALEQFVETWTSRFATAGATVALQGRIPVVVVADRDRWRALVASAVGGDPAVHRDVAVVYTAATAGGVPRAMVLVAPDSDRTRQRFAAAVGVARALLHYAGSPRRPPAWINEGLPRAMADLSVPGAGMDAALRQPALRAMRSGGSLARMLGARYADAVWSAEPELARSASYVFTRWLCEQDWSRTLSFAKKPIAGEPDDARFERIFGRTMVAAAAAAQRWFQTND